MQVRGDAECLSWSSHFFVNKSWEFPVDFHWRNRNFIDRHAFPQTVFGPWSFLLPQKERLFRCRKRVMPFCSWLGACLNTFGQNALILIEELIWLKASGFVWTPKTPTTETCKDGGTRSPGFVLDCLTDLFLDVPKARIHLGSTAVVSEVVWPLSCCSEHLFKLRITMLLRSMV